jgi:hypothetical protein
MKKQLANMFKELLAKSIDLSRLMETAFDINNNKIDNINIEK